MNRQQKIEFLKGLLFGTRSINEIRPIKHENWFTKGDGIYYQHTFYNTSKCDEKLSYDELKRRQELDPFTLHIVAFKNYSTPKAMYEQDGKN